MQKILNLLSSLSFRLSNRFVYRQTRAALKAGRLRIGRHTYGRPILEEYQGSLANVSIGHYCSIGPDVRIITGGNHATDRVSTFPFRIRMLNDRSYNDGMPYTNGDIMIGSDVWIGSHVTIMSGISVGHGAVIAAGAVVTRDLEPYGIYGGVPAKLLKYRFDANTVSRLLASNWWSMEEKVVISLIPQLSSADIEEFLDAVHRLN
jgi:acetyltransferase-like isoleucine patch superfamily enzyme